MADLAKIDIRERLQSGEENIRTALDSLRSSIWTSLPCIVISFDPMAVTVSAQPSIRGVVQDQDGNRTAIDMPVLVDVPVIFPSGGGAYHTYPITAGDEALVVFASRNIDAWWQSGGVQNPMSTRTLNLSDGFAFVGPQSQAKKISNISATKSEWRNTAGTAGISFDPATGAITITAPGGLHIVADTTQTGDTNQTGSITASVDVIGHGTSLHSHVHTLTQPGTGLSGPPPA